MSQTHSHFEVTRFASVLDNIQSQNLSNSSSGIKCMLCFLELLRMLVTVQIKGELLELNFFTLLFLILNYSIIN